MGSPQTPRASGSGGSSRNFVSRVKAERTNRYATPLYWSYCGDSNSKPTDYKSVTLPVELQQLVVVCPTSQASFRFVRIKELNQGSGATGGDRTRNPLGPAF